MVNYNGELVIESTSLVSKNRGFLYGDAVFETVKIVNSKILFLEDHYFRLMSSMRITRMEIPMNFTLEYFEEQILALAKSENALTASRARITVFRNDGGYYLPKTHLVSFLITVEPIDIAVYKIDQNPYRVDLFTDFYVTKHLLSTIKTNNKLINITASIFANENGFDNCLLLNDAKNIVEALQGNLFMVKGNKLITPPISEGCLNGVMRKQILNLASKIDSIVVSEELISPFELQKADELFITNVIKGIQPITAYRKSEYSTDFAVKLVQLLNESLDLV